MEFILDLLFFYAIHYVYSLYSIQSDLTTHSVQKNLNPIRFWIFRYCVPTSQFHSTFWHNFEILNSLSILYDPTLKPRANFTLKLNFELCLKDLTRK